MRNLQFNPSTRNLLYNATTKKILMVGGECGYCPTAKTPERIHIKVSGILICNNLNVCCPATDSGRNYKKITSQGIGWNFVMVLDQGRIDNNGTGLYCSSNDICWIPDHPVYPCAWSGIKEDDFGSFELYNLENCLGGVVCNQYFWKIGVRVQRLTLAGNQDWFFVTIALACSYCNSPVAETTWFIFQHFGTVAEYGQRAGECLPFDIELPNHLICGDGACPDAHMCWKEMCIGNGIAILSLTAFTNIISGNADVAGVTMNGLPHTPVSDANGNYNDTVNSGWSGTVTPIKTGYTFSPTSKIYTNVMSDQLNQDYTANSP